MTYFSDTTSRMCTALFGPIAAANGVSESVIAAAEATLGVPIPAILREYYRLVGNMRDLRDANNHLHPPAKLYVLNDVLVFCEENQHCIVWGVKRSDLSQDDPPVFKALPDGLEWEQFHSRLSLFLFNHVCWQAVNALPSSARADLDDKTFQALQKSLVPLQSADGKTEADQVTFYRQGVSVVVFKPDVLYAGASSDANLKKFAKEFKLELDWL